MITSNKKTKNILTLILCLVMSFFMFSFYNIYNTGSLTNAANIPPPFEGGGGTGGGTTEPEEGPNDWWFQSGYTEKSQPIASRSSTKKHEYSFVYSNYDLATSREIYVNNVIVLSEKPFSSQCSKKGYTGNLDPSLVEDGTAVTLGGTQYCLHTTTGTHLRNLGVYYSNLPVGTILKADTTMGDNTNMYDNNIYFFRIPESAPKGGLDFLVFGKKYNDEAVEINLKYGNAHNEYIKALNFGVNDGSLTYAKEGNEADQDLHAGLYADDTDIRSLMVNKLSNGIYVIAGGWKKYSAGPGDSARYTNEGSVMFGWQSVLVYDTQAPTIGFEDEYSVIHTKKLEKVNVSIDGGLSPILNAQYMWSTTNQPNHNGSWYGLTAISSNGNANVYKIDGPKKVTGSHYLCIRTKDYAGNSTCTCSGPYEFDSIAPTMSITAESDQLLKSQNHYVHSIQVTITNSDTGGSELNNAYNQYCVSKNAYNCSTDTWNTYGSGETFYFGKNDDETLNGTRYLLVKKIYDNAGNIILIDEEESLPPPLIYAQGGSSPGYHYSDWIYYKIVFDNDSPKIVLEEETGTYIDGKYFVNEAKITLKASDANSGLSADNSYQYCFSAECGSCTDNAWVNYTSGTEFALNVPSDFNGIKYLLVKPIYDNVKQKNGEKSSNVSDSLTYIGVSGSTNIGGTYNKVWHFVELLFDSKKPSATISSDNTITNAEEISFVITWNEGVSLLNYYKYFSVSNGVLKDYNHTFNDDHLVTETTLTVIPMEDGYVRVKIEKDEVKDMAGNTNDEIQYSIISDRTAPIITVTVIKEGEGDKGIGFPSKERKVKIGHSDTNLDPPESREMKYCVSLDEKECSTGKWSDYILASFPNSTITIGSGLTGNYYLLIKNIQDRAGNWGVIAESSDFVVSGIGFYENESNTSENYYYVYVGEFNFDNTAPTLKGNEKYHNKLCVLINGTTINSDCALQYQDDLLHVKKGDKIAYSIYDSNEKEVQIEDASGITLTGLELSETDVILSWENETKRIILEIGESSAYNGTVSFTIPENTISDLAGNLYPKVISVSFYIDNISPAIEQNTTKIKNTNTKDININGIADASVYNGIRYFNDDSYIDVSFRFLNNEKIKDIYYKFDQETNSLAPDGQTQKITGYLYLLEDGVATENVTCEVQRISNIYYQVCVKSNINLKASLVDDSGELIFNDNEKIYFYSNLEIDYSMLAVDYAGNTYTNASWNETLVYKNKDYIKTYDIETFYGDINNENSFISMGSPFAVEAENFDKVVKVKGTITDPNILGRVFIKNKYCNAPSGITCTYNPEGSSIVLSEGATPDTYEFTVHFDLTYLNIPRNSLKNVEFKFELVDSAGNLYGDQKVKEDTVLEDYIGLNIEITRDKLIEVNISTELSSEGILINGKNYYRGTQGLIYEFDSGQSSDLKRDTTKNIIFCWKYIDSDNCQAINDITFDDSNNSPIITYYVGLAEISSIAQNNEIIIRLNVDASYFFYYDANTFEEYRYGARNVDIYLDNIAPIYNKDVDEVAKGNAAASSITDNLGENGITLFYKWGVNEEYLEAETLTSILKYDGLDGPVTFHYKVVDKVGNFTEGSYVVVVDNTPPTATFVRDKEVDGNFALHQKYSTTIYDEIKGINSGYLLKYVWLNEYEPDPSVDSVIWEYADTVVYTEEEMSFYAPTTLVGNYYLYIFVEDKVGNQTVLSPKYDENLEFEDKYLCLDNPIILIDENINANNNPSIEETAFTLNSQNVMNGLFNIYKQRVVADNGVENVISSKHYGDYLYTLSKTEEETQTKIDFVINNEMGTKPYFVIAGGSYVLVSYEYKVISGNDVKLGIAFDTENCLSCLSTEMLTNKESETIVDGEWHLMYKLVKVNTGSNYKFGYKTYQDKTYVGPIWDVNSGNGVVEIKKIQVINLGNSISTDTNLSNAVIATGNNDFAYMLNVLSASENGEDYNIPGISLNSNSKKIEKNITLDRNGYYTIFIKTTNPIDSYLARKIMVSNVNASYDGNIVYSSSSKYNNASKKITITFNFTHNIDIVGPNPELILNVYSRSNTSSFKRASYTSGSGSNALTFTYTVGIDDEIEGNNNFKVIGVLNKESIKFGGQSVTFADEYNSSDLYIDTVAPEVEFEKKIAIYTNTTIYYNFEVTENISFDSNDIKYAWLQTTSTSDQIFWTRANFLYGNRFSAAFDEITDDGTYYLHVKATDKAGNSSVYVSNEVIFDTLNPTLSVETRVLDEAGNVISLNKHTGYFKIDFVITANDESDVSIVNKNMITLNDNSKYSIDYENSYYSNKVAHIYVIPKDSNNKTGIDTITLNIPDGAFKDKAGNFSIGTSASHIANFSEPVLNYVYTHNSKIGVDNLITIETDTSNNMSYGTIVNNFKWCWSETKFTKESDFTNCTNGLNANYNIGDNALNSTYIDDNESGYLNAIIKDNDENTKIVSKYFSNKKPTIEFVVPLMETAYKKTLTFSINSALYASLDGVVSTIKYSRYIVSTENISLLNLEMMGYEAFENISGFNDVKDDFQSGININITGKTGKFYVYAYVEDTFGNKVVSKAKQGDVDYTVNFDNTIPNEVIITPSSNLTYNKSHTLTVTAFDANSGIDRISYAWHVNNYDAPATNMFTNVYVGEGNNETGWTINVIGNELTGTHYLWVKATDKAGNVTDNIVSGAFNFDNTAPMVTAIASTGYNEVSVTAKDDDSGLVGGSLAKLEYRWVDIATQTPCSEWLTTTFTGNPGDTTATKVLKSTSCTGASKLLVKVTDVVGNTSKVYDSDIDLETNFVFDNTNPTISNLVTKGEYLSNSSNPHDPAKVAAFQFDVSENNTQTNKNMIQIFRVGINEPIDEGEYIVNAIAGKNTYIIYIYKYTSTLTIDSTIYAKLLPGAIIDAYGNPTLLTYTSENIIIDNDAVSVTNVKISKDNGVSYNNAGVETYIKANDTILVGVEFSDTVSEPGSIKITGSDNKTITRALASKGGGYYETSAITIDNTWVNGYLAIEVNNFKSTSGVVGTATFANSLIYDKSAPTIEVTAVNEYVSDVAKFNLILFDNLTEFNQLEDVDFSKLRLKANGVLYSECGEAPCFTLNKTITNINNFSITVSGISSLPEIDGKTITLSLLEGFITDESGNMNVVTNPFASSSVDIIAPALDGEHEPSYINKNLGTILSSNTDRLNVNSELSYILTFDEEITFVNPARIKTNFAEGSNASCRKTVEIDENQKNIVHLTISECVNNSATMQIVLEVGFAKDKALNNSAEITLDTTFIVDNIKPIATITAYTDNTNSLNPQTKLAKNGSIITIEVRFSEEIDESRWFASSFSGTTIDLVYTKIVNGEDVYYKATHTVAESDGFVNGRNIYITVGSYYDLALNSNGADNVNQEIKYSNEAAVIMGITAPAGYYKEDDVITFTLEFSENVYADDSYLTIKTSNEGTGVANLTGGSGTKFLTYEYTIQAGDNIDNVLVKTVEGSIYNLYNNVVTEYYKGGMPIPYNVCLDTTNPLTSSFTITYDVGLNNGNGEYKYNSNGNLAVSIISTDTGISHIEYIDNNGKKNVNFYKETETTFVANIENYVLTSGYGDREIAFTAYDKAGNSVEISKSIYWNNLVTMNLYDGDDLVINTNDYYNAWQQEYKFVITLSLETSLTTSINAAQDIYYRWFTSNVVATPDMFGGSDRPTNIVVDEENNIATITIISPSNIKMEERYKLWFYVDVNISQEVSTYYLASTNVLKIDNTISDFALKLEGIEAREYYETEIYTNKDVKVGFAYNDRNGMKLLTVEKSGVVTTLHSQENPITDLKAYTYNIAENGRYTFAVTDNNNNTKSIILDVSKIDKDEFDIDVYEVKGALETKITGNLYTNVWYKEADNSQIKISFVDEASVKSPLTDYWYFWKLNTNAYSYEEYAFMKHYSADTTKEQFIIDVRDAINENNLNGSYNNNPNGLLYKEIRITKPSATGIYDLYIGALDKANNFTLRSIGNVKIDNINPIIYLGETDLSLNVRDEHSKLSSVEYYWQHIDEPINEDWTSAPGVVSGESSISFTAEHKEELFGKYYLYYKVYDIAGNYIKGFIAREGEPVVYIIDTDAPTVKVPKFESGTNWLNVKYVDVEVNDAGYILPNSIGYLLSNNDNLEMSAVENNQNYAIVQSVSNVTKVRFTVNFPSNIVSGTYYLYVIASDLGNNKTMEIIDIKVDYELPTISYDNTALNNPTNKPVTLAFTFNDGASGSGVSRYYVRNSYGQDIYYAENESLLNATFTVNGEYKVIVYDKAGNAKEESISVKNIDKTPMQFSINSTYDSVNVLNSKLYTTGGEHEYKLATYALSKNGWASVSEFEVYYLTPSILYGYMDNQYFAELVDSASKITSVYEEANGNKYIVINSNGHYIFVLTDLAGNITYKLVTIENIDNDAPMWVDGVDKFDFGTTIIKDNKYLYASDYLNFTLKEETLYDNNEKVYLQFSIDNENWSGGRLLGATLSTDKYYNDAADLSTQAYPKYTGKIWYRLRDDAGNVSGTNYLEFEYDNDVPNVWVSVTANDEPIENNKFYKSVKVNLSYDLEDKDEILVLSSAEKVLYKRLDAYMLGSNQLMTTSTFNKYYTAYKNNYGESKTIKEFVKDTLNNGVGAFEIWANNGTYMDELTFSNTGQYQIWVYIEDELGNHSMYDYSADGNIYSINIDNVEPVINTLVEYENYYVYSASSGNYLVTKNVQVGNAIDEIYYVVYNDQVVVYEPIENMDIKICLNYNDGESSCNDALISDFDYNYFESQIDTTHKFAIFVTDEAGNQKVSPSIALTASANARKFSSTHSLGNFVIDILSPQGEVTSKYLKLAYGDTTNYGDEFFEDNNNECQGGSEVGCYAVLTPTLFASTHYQFELNITDDARIIIYTRDEADTYTRIDELVYIDTEAPVVKINPTNKKFTINGNNKVTNNIKVVVEDKGINTNKNYEYLLIKDTVFAGESYEYKYTNCTFETDDCLKGLISFVIKYDTKIKTLHYILDVEGRYVKVNPNLANGENLAVRGTTYYLYDGEDYIVDDGKILPLHYIDVNGVKTPVDVSLIGNVKDINENYYLYDEENNLWVLDKLVSEDSYYYETIVPLKGNTKIKNGGAYTLYATVYDSAMNSIREQKDINVDLAAPTMIGLAYDSDTEITYPAENEIYKENFVDQSVRLKVSDNASGLYKLVITKTRKQGPETITCYGYPYRNLNASGGCLESDPEHKTQGVYYADEGINLYYYLEQGIYSIVAYDIVGNVSNVLEIKMDTEVPNLEIGTTDTRYDLEGNKVIINKEDNLQDNNTYNKTSVDNVYIRIVEESISLFKLFMCPYSEGECDINGTDFTSVSTEFNRLLDSSVQYEYVSIDNGQARSEYIDQGITLYVLNVHGRMVVDNATNPITNDNYIRRSVVGYYINLAKLYKDLTDNELKDKLKDDKVITIVVYDKAGNMVKKSIMVDVINPLISTTTASNVEIGGKNYSITRTNIGGTQVKTINVEYGDLNPSLTIANITYKYISKITDNGETLTGYQIAYNDNEALRQNLLLVNYNYNLNEIGTYLVNYTYFDKVGNQNAAQVAIKVADTTAPTIAHISGEKDANVNIEFIDKGVEVRDAYKLRFTNGLVQKEAGNNKVGYLYYAVCTYIDEQNTLRACTYNNRVTINRRSDGKYGYTFTKTGEYKLTYTAYDYEGNVKTISKTIEVKDTEAPIISALPNENVNPTIKVGNVHNGEYASIRVLTPSAYDVGENKTTKVYLKGVYDNNTGELILPTKYRISAYAYIRVDDYNVKNQSITYYKYEIDLGNNTASFVEDNDYTSLTIDNYILEKVTNFDSIWALEHIAYIDLEFKEVSRNNPYIIRFGSQDIHSNYRTFDYSINVIDDIAPELILDENEEYGDKLVQTEDGYTLTLELGIDSYEGISFSASDNYDQSGELNNNIEFIGADLLPSGRVNALGTTLITVFVKDSSGNRKEATITVKVVDTTAPSVGAITTYADGWSKEATVNFTVSNGQDNSNQTPSIKYSTDQETWYNYTGVSSVSLPQEVKEGIVTLYVKYVDASGNESDVITKDVKIDTLAPRIKGAQNATIATEAVTITVEDGYLDTGSITVNGNAITETTFNLDTNGIYKIKAFDMAGNENILEFIVNLDNSIDVLLNEYSEETEKVIFKSVQLINVMIDENDETLIKYYLPNNLVYEENDEIIIYGKVPGVDGSFYKLARLNATSIDTTFEHVIEINAVAVKGENDDAYDFVMEMGGDYYLYLVVSEGTAFIPDPVYNPSEEEGSSSALVWILVIVGILGLGFAIFQIMKMRRKVKAA